MTREKKKRLMIIPRGGSSEEGEEVNDDTMTKMTTKGVFRMTAMKDMRMTGILRKGVVVRGILLPPRVAAAVDEE